MNVSPGDPINEATARLLPDSRLGLRRKATEVCGFGQIYERIYCINCGRNGGLVTKGWAETAQYLCDGCVFKHGRELTDKLKLLEIPEEIVRNAAPPALIGA